MNALVWFYSVA